MVAVAPAMNSTALLLHDMSWGTYLAVREAFGDRAVRVTYDRGRMEIVAPSDLHERFKKLIDRMLWVLAEECGLPLRSQGSTTFRREDVQCGLEPDECYYIQHEAVVRGRDVIDLEQDPPPDLAVEVDVTSSCLDRLPVYAQLGVPEVWRYDGEQVKIFVRTAGLEYVEQVTSLAFPLVSADVLSEHLARRNEADEGSWLREFRKRIQQVLRQLP